MGKPGLWEKVLREPLNKRAKEILEEMSTLEGFPNSILIHILLKWKSAFAQRAECGPGWATLPQRWWLCAKATGTLIFFTPYIPKLQKQKALWPTVFTGLGFVERTWTPPQTWHQNSLTLYCADCASPMGIWPVVFIQCVLVKGQNRAPLKIIITFHRKLLSKKSCGNPYFWKWGIEMKTKDSNNFIF